MKERKSKAVITGCVMGFGNMLYDAVEHLQKKKKKMVLNMCVGVLKCLV